MLKNSKMLLRYWIIQEHNRARNVRNAELVDAARQSDRVNQNLNNF